MELIGIIPARYASSRFPGKSLVNIRGIPLIVRVYRSAQKFRGWKKLIVATDDNRIVTTCDEYNIPSIMTSSNHPDCIDRAAEVAEKMEADRYIVLQGDEPFFDARILNVDLSPSIVNFFTKVTDISELEDPNVVKVIVSKNLRAIYYSRHSIPYHSPSTQKGNDKPNIDKQIGTYSFSREALRQFSVLGMSYLEGIEGIGLLRFLENDVDIHMRYAQYDSLSIDSPQDVLKAERHCDIIDSCNEQIPE